MEGGEIPGQRVGSPREADDVGGQVERVFGGHCPVDTEANVAEFLYEPSQGRFRLGHHRPPSLLLRGWSARSGQGTHRHPQLYAVHDIGEVCVEGQGQGVLQQPVHLEAELGAYLGQLAHCPHQDPPRVGEDGDCGGHLWNGPVVL